MARFDLTATVRQSSRSQGEARRTEYPYSDSVKSASDDEKPDNGTSSLPLGRLRQAAHRVLFGSRATLGLGDTFQLQQLLGHTSLEMVRRYVSLASVQGNVSCVL